MFNFFSIQELLKQYGIDGWLLYDFRRSNLLACRLLEIPQTQLLTRRFFYWIPKEGNPSKIISSVENPLRHLPGEETIFHSWRELDQILNNLLGKFKKIAMEYSPFGTTPEVSRVDGGTIDWVKKTGVEIVSSGDLLQELMCVWDNAKWHSHLYAAETLNQVAKDTWNWIFTQHQKEVFPTEYEVQQLMLQAILDRECITEHPPICAVNQHSSDPHYEPQKNSSSPIHRGDWVLIDLWCKKNQKNSVYGDITRVGFMGKTPSKRHREIFEIVKKAQKAAFEFVNERFRQGIPIRGFEVDEICRKVIEEAGYAPFFLHRTGHNIDESDHGPGAHLDDLETKEMRMLLPKTCFSIEPGIYLPGEFGVRLEYDVYLDPLQGAIITGGIQEKIVTSEVVWG